LTSNPGAGFALCEVVFDMPIPIDCDCGHSLRVREELAGRKIRCPKCAKVSVVPQPPAKDAEDTALDILLDEPAGKKTSSRLQAAKPMPARDEPKAPSPPSSDLSDLQRPVYKPPPPAKAPPAPGKEKRDPGRGSIAVHPSIISGLLMMIGAAVWFFLGLAADRIFFYPPILFILGIGAIIRGFKGGDLRVRRAGPPR
jgi:hypothetical protein